jgi:hypothetical protein
MRRHIPFLAAAICFGLLTLLSPARAYASQLTLLNQAVSIAQPQSAAVIDVGYYGGGDYYGDFQKQDDDYDREYRKDGYGSGAYDGYRHRYYRKHYNEYPNRCCDDGCYKKKWVCDESEPRCFRQRECIWSYGKEYCRYVRRCHGGGDRYCKWISAPNRNCGY